MALSEIFMENQQLDISKDLSTLLTFSLDDLKDFSARSTTWSKTIVLPGTKNNNKIFGNIFQVGQSNSYDPSMPNVLFNFNASKSANVIIFQDQIQTFVGVLRLMQVNTIDGRIEYETSVFGKLAGLNVALSSGFISDLDFSQYDEAFTTANIKSSWNNSSGAGLYYPLIDYGNYGRNAAASATGKQSWDIRTFRPALFVKEYIDKMFEAAGYRYSSALFNTTRFKKLIVPHNAKVLTKNSNISLSANSTGKSFNEITDSNSFQLPWDNVPILGNFLNGSIDFTYNSGTSIITDINFNFFGNYIKSSAITPVIIRVMKNATVLYSMSFGSGVLSGNIGIQEVISGVVINNGDVIYADVTISTGTFTLDANYNLLITNNINETIPITPGDTIFINETIPKNIRQIDFLVSIVKLFNLYVYEDKSDPTLIYLTPYVDFYTTDSSDSIDWSYKLDRSQAIKVKPMSEINAKKYEFKWKSDNDYYNELYRKRYSQGYGDYVFDSQFEFAEQKKELELIFSSTVLVGYIGEDKVYPTIMKRTGPDTAPVEEQTDSNIRIMQTLKVTGVTSWHICDGFSSIDTTTDYGYAGHFDNPDAPSNDLNFGVLFELFFILATGNLTVTQFNVYWSSYMAEITDKDSKLLTAKFKLTVKDIYELDFSKLIYIDGILYRLSKISDYNMSKPDNCQVQLLKVNYLIY